MNKLSWYQYLVNLVVTGGVISFSVSAGLRESLAFEVNKLSPLPDKQNVEEGKPTHLTSGGSRAMRFPPLPDNQNVEEERPLNRTSGGSRGGSCLELLVALVPGEGKVNNLQDPCNSQSTSLPTQTLTELPTFWFYLPPLSIPELRAELVLLNDNPELLHKQTMIVGETSGIVHVQLTYPLELDQNYRWSFSLLVNPQRPSQNPTVEGRIKRVTANSELREKLQGATSQRERILIYADHYLWHDALTALIIMGHQAPEDDSWKTDWSNFLDSVGLSAIAEAPLVDCCVTEK